MSRVDVTFGAMMLLCAAQTWVRFVGLDQIYDGFAELSGLDLASGVDVLISGDAGVFVSPRSAAPEPELMYVIA
jgi:hypothetical protein